MAANIPIAEYNALQSLFNATNGNYWRWRNVTADIPWVFSSGANPCTDNWQGIKCNRVPPYHVQDIDLSAYNLTGTLPPTLSAFSQLAQLDLSNNYIFGPIPSEVGELVTLKDLFLDHNTLTGFIPSSFGSLVNVEKMHLGNNLLHGSIPDEIGDMISMQFLTLNYLDLNGTIPQTFANLENLHNLEMAYLNEHGPGLHGYIDCLSNLPNLTTLSLEYNSLSGTISPNFGNLTRLTSFDLDHNFLTGTLPPALGQLSNLISTYLDHNYLTGTIPASFGNLTSLKDMYLYANHLQGSIPESLGALSELVVFDVQGNRITSTLPNSLRNLTKLYSFIANNNRMWGTIPAFFGEYHRLGNLFIGDNDFTGTIPAELGDLRNLEYLSLSGCALQGTIPASLGASHFLNTILLYDNYLTGTLSASLGQLGNLNDLELNNNFLEGTIPRNFSALNKLSVLRLFGNKFSGSLDGVFDSTIQTQLSSIQVNDNSFTGTLPAEMFLLPQLSTFAATSNCFDGSLPHSVCAAANLANLVLDGLSSADACKQRVIPGVSQAYTADHSMHGTIPSCVFNLPQLTTLHLSGNKFTGSIPTDVVISSTLTDMSLSFNTLTGSIPSVIQERQWNYSLDLSYNRLSGTLQQNFAPAPNDAAVLSLQNNRLTGRIPTTVAAMLNVSILGSNLFSCALDGHDLPAHDDSSHNSVANYQCGSTTFEIWYYLWIAATAVAATLLLLVIYGYVPKSANWSEWIARCTASSEPPVENNVELKKASSVHTPQVGLLFQESDALVKLAALCTVFMVVVLLPLYAALSAHYGTLVHQYAWNVSAAFLSGKVSFSLLVVFWALLLLFLAVMYYVLIQRTGVRQRIVETSTKDENADDRLWSKLWCQKIAIYGIFLLCNVTVVMGVNVAYIVVAIGQSSTLLVIVQILMSFFKLGWNNVCAAYVLQKTVQYVHGVDREESINLSRNAFTTLRIGVTLLNTIAIPCLVVAAIAPACFYNVFVYANPVTSSYEYQTCSIISPTSGGCLTYEMKTSSSSYHPPFTYNYQCSSSLITYYAPAFVNLCISNAFLSPLLQVLVVLMHKRAQIDTCCGWWRWLLGHAVPNLLRPIQEPAGTTSNLSTAESSTPLTEGSRRFLDGNQLIITLVGYAGLLLTFGAVFPPLAVAIAVTVAIVTLYAKLRVGRFLCTAEGVGRIDLIVALERELQDRHATEVLQYGLWMLLTASCWFYTLFLFDTLGDAVGFDNAYWVLIVFPSLPVVLYVLYTWTIALLGPKVTHTITVGGESSSREQLKSDDVELSAHSSVLGNVANSLPPDDDVTYNVL